MKYFLSKAINLITDDDNEEYRWNDVLVKSTILIFSIYILATIDAIIYGYLTR